ncbi:pleckstrin homology domain-containing family B member 2-like isoform X2 [Amphiura filiformis]|uniref:pleckstrin homology domain-containing family B member 2-like isoform X2 n=1 Tax=Amphiura filiformis TaxID=82378 RepID=UPI003B213EE5
MKSGWLHRQSDFLRRWKRSFCVLHNDGRFIYYTNESQREVEGTLNLFNLYSIKVGHEVPETPPSNHSTESLFQVKTPENIIVFCADSRDDAEAWKVSMFEAKQANTQPRTAPYTASYSNAPPVYSDAPPPYAAAVGHQTVTTTTTYPNGRRVVVRRNGTTPHNGVYPMQTAAYSYPGQTVYTTYGAPTAAGAVPGQNYQVTQTYYYN